MIRPPYIALDHGRDSRDHLRQRLTFNGFPKDPSPTKRRSERSRCFCPSTRRRRTDSSSSSSSAWQERTKHVLLRKMVFLSQNCCGFQGTSFPNSSDEVRRCQQRSTADHDFGTLLSGTVGDNFTLCWGHDPGGVGDFNVVVDPDAELIGPADKEFRYTSDYIHF